MGEARRWRIRKAAMEVAYLLDGEEGVKGLIDPGETVACPLCVRGLRPAKDMVRPDRRQQPLLICFFCKGKGGIQRVVRYLPGFAPGDVPFAPIVKTDSLACVPSPRRW